MKIIAEDELDMSDISSIPPADDSYGLMDWSFSDDDGDGKPPAPRAPPAPPMPGITPETITSGPSPSIVGPPAVQPPPALPASSSGWIPPSAPMPPLRGILRRPVIPDFPSTPPDVPGTSLEESDHSMSMDATVPAHNNPPPPPSGGSAPVALDNIRIPVPSDVSPPAAPIYDPDMDMQGGSSTTRGTNPSVPPALGPGRPPRLNLNPLPPNVIASPTTAKAAPERPTRTGPTLPSAGSASTPVVTPSSTIPSANQSRARTPATPRKASEHMPAVPAPTPVHLPTTDPDTETEEDHLKG